VTDEPTDDEGADPPGDDRQQPPESAVPEMTPTVSCSRCDREWELTYELDDRRAGNQAVEQFALDHSRHTGHYPDDVSPWIVTCRRCPETEQFLAERPARRLAETHVRHTGHEVGIEPPDEETEQLVEAPDGHESTGENSRDSDSG